MYSALINAVLRSSPDYDLLFESLCWPEDSLPQTELVESLTALIEALAPSLTIPDLAQVTLTDAKRRCIHDKIESIIWSKCLPFLRKISTESGGEDRCRQGTAAVCRLLAVSVSVCDQKTWTKVVSSTLPSLQWSPEEELSGALSVNVAAEVLAALMPLPTADEEFTLSILNCALSSIPSLPDNLVSKVTVRVILTLLNCFSDVRSSCFATRIMDAVCSWHSSERSAAVTQRALLCFTVLLDHLLKSHTVTSDTRFWTLVQDGLTHGDSVSRKRALYLLKRCVALSDEEGFDSCSTSEEEEALFNWAPDKSGLLREFWEDYTLVMETLEENQVHVVRPVLNRIDTLIQATANDSEGLGLFHPSWLLCVYQRMFHSENKSLMREGVCHLLELQVLRQSAFAAAFSQFVVGPFMDVLSETSLFCRSPGQSVGDCPELAGKLQVFLVNFFTSLPSEDRGCVLLQLIQQLGSKHWCAVPLLFICQALSKLPQSPLLRSSGLSALREVLRSTMITHQVLLRGAAQCFLLKSTLSLIDVSEVTRDDVFSFLMHFRADESLCRGTTLWNELCIWLSEHDGNFKPRILDGDCVDGPAQKETIRLYVQQEVIVYLRVPASTGQAERLPDIREADKLARAILLCVDMERRELKKDARETLRSLLSPLLDTLSRVYTNIYLPVHKSDKSLQLMLRLLQLSTRPRCQQQGLEEDDLMLAIEQAVVEVVDPVQNFILRRLCGELQELFDVERADLYLCVLKQLAALSSSLPHGSKNIHQYASPKLIMYSLSVLKKPTQQIPSVANQVSEAVSMASLAAVCDLLQQGGTNMSSETASALKSLNDYFYTFDTSTKSQPSLRNINKRLMKPQLLDSTSDLVTQGLLQQDWGRIAASFLRDQWVCLNFLIRSVGIPKVSETLRAALSCSVEALALLPSDLVLPVLNFMNMALPQLVDDEEDLCVQAVNLSWELVQGLSNNAHDFWPALQGFISIAFQHELLKLNHQQAPALTAALKRIFTEVVELSQSKSGVLGVLVQHCTQTWLPGEGGSSELADGIFSSVFNHLDIVTEACLYGPVFRRDQRLIQDVQIFVEQLGENCAANVAVASDNRDDQLPRTCVLTFLSRLDPCNQQHQRLIEELVVELLRKDSLISKAKVRYYSNSLQHRIKNRAWQTLLLLLPKLTEEFVATLLNSVFEAGFCSNQPSVKYLIEWMMILILVKYPHHLDRFWTCFSFDHEKTKTSICTFLSVLVHISVIIPHVEDKVDQLRKALDIILQSCFNHNFSVRLYALVALKRVWSLAESVTEGDAFRGLSSVVTACLNQAEAMQNSGNANKNWLRIQGHFFFSAFHPIRDYSLE
ncbi:PREDICTED: probable methyltransferase TARBP1, partial [Cyprinodon variegatus]|uniref:probable methyltransferase TARBP1 n=1 Tax=Cyprinodon variegatus TaxID=28743 RepID=UPI0007426E09